MDSIERHFTQVFQRSVNSESSTLTSGSPVDVAAALEVIAHAVIRAVTEIRGLRGDLKGGAVYTDDRVAVPIVEAMRRLSCRRTRIHELLNRGLLQRAPKPGKQTLILAASIDKLIQSGVPDKQIRRPRLERHRVPVGGADVREAIMKLPL